MSGKNLTRDEAARRAELIEVTSYDIELDLTTGEETFATKVVITFDARRPGESTFVDFIGDSVASIDLDGRAIDPATAFADHRIAIDELAGHNTLTISATGRYTNTGEGLHRFVDPVDGEVYLYSQFEVPDSRRVFPVFEQPDLKATFAFTVTAPAGWTVLSNQPTPAPVTAGRGRATWTFAPTPRLSSYVTAICAGPYVGVTDTYDGVESPVPLGIYSRRSIAENVDAENIFDVTKKGFAFLEREFDRAYPFEKYDQIFAPEYNAGAMENAGCVTITEVYAFRGKVAEALVERRALTILHEQAHMWFGDLVTMNWWDDLWLNESFAEWASSVAQAEATDWSDAWTTFASHEKTWAYQQDQQKSTHPVVADMVDLQAVEVNFDGITYAKGGSILKQLVAYVGRDAFREGVRGYFRRHAWGNTSMKDFLGALEEASGRDLDTWAQRWLLTSGVNTMRVATSVDAHGTITGATVVQTFDEGYPTLRPHRMAIGAYELRGEGSAARLERVARVEIDVDGERTDVPELVGRQAPDLLLPNDDDLTYCKVLLDPRSEATALAHPLAFPESLVRTLVVGSFWERVRVGDFPAGRFVDFLLATLPGEEHSTALRTILSTTKQIPSMLQSSANWFVTPERRDQVRATVAATLRRMAETAPAGSDTQFQLVTTFALVASSGQDIARLRGAFDGSQPYPGLTIDQDLRWGLLTALVAAGAADPAEIDAELAADDTNDGRERAALVRAAIPTPEAKRAAWEAVLVGGATNSVVESSGKGFNRSSDGALIGPYIQRYHDALLEMYANNSIAIAERFVKYWYPLGLVGPELSAASHAWLDANPDAPAALRRLLIEQVDAVDIAVHAQQRDALG